MNTFYFISGFPRSGSTLLSALLRQNPRFSAGISSPVAPMCKGLLNVMGTRGEHTTQFTEEQKKALLAGVFTNYYQGNSSEEVIFDTNRSWCARLGILHQLFENPKVICCVRNVAWVMDSFERLVQRHPFIHSRLFNDDGERATVYSRTDALGRKNRVVGYSVAALREAFYGSYSSSLLLVDYELLSRFPQKCLALIYEFLGEEPYIHDVDNVVFEESDFDDHLGLPGMHKVQKKVQYKERQTLLPPDIFQKYDQMIFWQNQEGSLASVISFPAK